MLSVTLAICCSVLSASISDAATVRMSSESSCPSDAEFAAAIAASDDGVRQIVGVSDSRVCSVSCASWDLCAVSRFVSSSRSCQLATQTVWLRLWRLSNDTGCVSLVRPPIPPPTLFSKLLALYNFRFGLNNLAAGNPNALPNANATSSVIRVPRAGYRLGEFSYLELNLGGQPFSARLSNPNKKVTIFAKVTPSGARPFVLLSLHKRSEPIDSFKYGARLMVEVDGKLTWEARDLSNSKYSTAASASSMSTFSCAVSFDPSDVKFYYNGTWSTNLAPVVAGANAASGDEVMRIGFDVVYSFPGTVHCYAVAADNLQLSELWQLEHVC